jgi:hypothetical protein
MELLLKPSPFLIRALYQGSTDEEHCILKEEEMDTNNRTMIRSNPLLETYRIALLAFGIMTVAAFFLTVLFVWAALMEGQVRRAFNGPTIDLPVFVLLLLILSLQYRRLKRIERCRLAAARGELGLLADEQPAPDPGALTLPAIFQMRWSKAQFLFLAGLMELVILLYSIYGWLIIDRFPLLLALIGGTVLVLILVPVLFVTSRQTLDVTEEGLRLRASGQGGMVHWNEAQLFAVSSILGAQKSGALLTYELASASSIVRWTRIVRTSLFGLHMDPGMPLNEHNREMEALQRLIVAKTGLQLYDLRKGSTCGRRAKE